ncbi:hypothetical protein BZG36_02392 [Bifiguratus adelaidae]|uniref:L-serine ammonia-lyase n=1 Tax=Bifiguratus adelaidae TaxID=1938954 RepID=A0A261Y1A6_9FUNG|nr:hypothetical protein BZG36_02392 [Bifiguratus adelaidae]
MRAAKIFVNDLKAHNALARTASLRVDLFGSLALTGKGHGTPNAILMGIEGESPDTVETSSILSRVQDMHTTRSIHVNGTHRIQFDPEKDVVFNLFKQLPQHPNGMRFCAYDENKNLIATNEYFSIGGGFVVNEETQLEHGENVYYKGINKTLASVARREQDAAIATLPFRNAEELLQVCQRENMTIAQVVFENELRWRSSEEIREKVLGIWKVMDESIRNGVMADPESQLPGDLNVHRRAPKLYKKLLKGLYGTDHLQTYISTALPSQEAESSPTKSLQKPSQMVLPRRQPKRFLLPALDYLSVYAIAVNEENACGGRVVTAPTNGAAGTIPAVLKYYLEFISENPETDVMEFLLTSAAVGMLYKRGATVMGGTVEQVENAAEIGMEHNLGLTCDPVAGLVQVPCIERNALAAVKAIAAAQLALNGEGTHRVSLDQVIETMRQTGNDMMSKYKETSQGGLAVNVPMC